MNYLKQKQTKKTDNFESHNSLKLSFTNIQGLCSNFIECESSLNQIRTKSEVWVTATGLEPTTT